MAGATGLETDILGYQGAHGVRNPVFPRWGRPLQTRQFPRIGPRIGPRAGKRPNRAQKAAPPIWSARKSRRVQDDERRQRGAGAFPLALVTPRRLKGSGAGSRVPPWRPLRFT